MYVHMIRYLLDLIKFGEKIARKYTKPWHLSHRKRCVKETNEQNMVSHKLKLDVITARFITPYKLKNSVKKKWDYIFHIKLTDRNTVRQPHNQLGWSFESMNDVNALLVNGS